LATWKIEDDCLAPGNKYRVDYIGPNPFRIANAIKGILRRVMEVETKDVWERDFRWDNTGDPRGFFNRWYVLKPRDLYSKVFLEVTLQGLQPSDPNKDGKLVMLIGGRVRTDFNLNSAFKKSPLYSGRTNLGGLGEIGGLLWFWNRIFYNDIRRQHIRWCNSKVDLVWRELRGMLKMPVPERTI